MKEYKTYVKFDGYGTIIHNGALTNPYGFRSGQWTEIDEADAERYTKRASRNELWSIKREEADVKVLVTYARFMGTDEHKNFVLKFYDYDVNDMPIDDTVRVYEFPKKEWVIIHEKDRARLQLKATANPHWEYKKELLSENEEIIHPDEPKLSLKEKVKEKLKKEPKEETEETPVEPPADPHPTVEAAE